jgi:hypothetical protein
MLVASGRSLITLLWSPDTFTEVWEMGWGGTDLVMAPLCQPSKSTRRKTTWSEHLFWVIRGQAQQNILLYYWIPFWTFLHLKENGVSHSSTSWVYMMCPAVRIIPSPALAIEGENAPCSGFSTQESWKRLQRSLGLYLCPCREEAYSSKTHPLTG